MPRPYGKWFVKLKVIPYDVYLVEPAFIEQKQNDRRGLGRVCISSINPNSTRRPVKTTLQIDAHEPIAAWPIPRHT